MPRTLLTVTLALAAGCAQGSRDALFSDTPSFELDAWADGQQTLLDPWGYDVELTEDELCEDDDEGCDDVVFRGFLFYRSDDGPWGTYALVHTQDEPAWTDPAPAHDDMVWRVGILRQTGDEPPEIAGVSVAGIRAEP